MSESGIPTGNQPEATETTTIEHPPDPDQIDLIIAASQPDADPCEIACDALPAHTIGDLSKSESDWIRQHTSDCRYCENELNRYEQVTRVLDQIYQRIDFGAAPVPPALPTRKTAWYLRLASPVGPLFVAATDDALVEIEFSKGRSDDELRRHLIERGFNPKPMTAEAEVERPSHAVIGQVVQQLREYFGGQRNQFDLPLDLSGLPTFTRGVLEATAKVPFGHLDTYRGIAQQIGAPRATRAVGNALNRNPIPVVVPCHRIIRSDGSAGGYGGGLDIKYRLLAHEGVMLSGASR